MKIVPFVLKKVAGPKLTTYKLSVFLANGGHSLWEADDTNVLEENEIYTSRVFQSKNMFFCEVDLSKTKLEEFYSWEEAQQDPKKKTIECWRDYYFFYDDSGGEWWSPRGIFEAEIQDVGNISGIFGDILRHIT